MKIRPVYQAKTKSYADHTPQPTADTLDCSLGVNPYGPPSQALEAVRAFDLAHLGDYPHSWAAHDAIIGYWADQTKLTRENILLVDGSVSALYLINPLFALPRAKVVGFAPTFTDMVVNVEMQGMTYVPVVPTREDFAEDVDALLAAMDEETSLVYIDNPNNPTGQLLPKADLIRVLDKAKELQAAVLIDEAYGDFVSKEESILSEREKYDNLLVLRTFSKGFGLAGLRAGYIITDPLLISYMSKTTNPYCMNELTRYAAAAAMTAEGYPSAHGPDFAKIKEELRAVTGNKLTLLATDGRVPICSLRHKEDVDLQALLFEEGVLTVSGAEFDAMDARCVRLRVPKGSLAGKLIEAVRRVNEG